MIFYDDFEKKLEKKTKADTYRYILLATCLIILGCVMLSFCYRTNLKQAIFSDENRDAERLLMKKINRSTSESDRVGLV